MKTNHPSTPVIYSHRGASGYAPENTLSAFLLALEMGADGIEFDVKLTRDGRVIVLHDPTLDRTTNGKGSYKNLSFDELRTLDAGGWKDSRYRGERLPLLEEVFEAVGGKMGINIELTNYTTPGDGLVEAVVKILNNEKNIDNVMFSSFFARNLRTAKRLLPDVPRGLLANDGISGWPQRAVLIYSKDYHALHPYYKDTSARLVDRIHSTGRQVNIWTVNEPAEMLRLKNLGVDMIMTDFPDLAIRTVRG